MTIHDKRLSAVREDLADARLAGLVEARRYAHGRPARIAVAVADVMTRPGADAGLATQFLRGDDVLVFEEREGWSWVQGERDGYVGYVASSDIGGRDGTLTHHVVVPRSFLYPGPDMKRPRSGQLSMGASIAVVEVVEVGGTRYAMLDSGEAVIAAHIAPLADGAADYVSVAERLLETPYLWGGVSGFGIDCSGLVQLALRMVGKDVLRDSDMQAATIGEPIEPGPAYAGLRRGDLIFWKGHVAIMTDAATMVHANGHTMLVSREGLSAGIDRIGYLYGGPTGFRRP